MVGWEPSWYVIFPQALTFSDVLRWPLLKGHATPNKSHDLKSYSYQSQGYYVCTWSVTNLNCPVLPLWNTVWPASSWLQPIIWKFPLTVSFPENCTHDIGLLNKLARMIRHSLYQTSWASTFPSSDLLVLYSQEPVTEEQLLSPGQWCNWALATLTEDAQFQNPQDGWNSNSRASDTLFWLLRHCTLSTLTYMQAKDLDT